MFKDQELLISYIRTRVRVNWKGEMTIQEVAGIETKRNRFEESVYDKDTDEVREELIELHNRYELLEDNYEKLKELSQSITDDWHNSEVKARELQLQIDDMIVTHRAHVEKLKEEFSKREQELINENKEITGNFDNFRNSITKELKIKCTVLDRYVKYVDVMKKEIVIMKNIIKNPDLMKSALRTINYSDFGLYRFNHDDSCEMLNSGLEESAFNIKEARKASMVIKDIDKDRKLLASQITNRRNPISTANSKIIKSRLFSRGDNRSVKFRNHKRSRSSIATITNISARRQIINLSQNRSKISTPKAGEYRFNVSIGSQ